MKSFTNLLFLLFIVMVFGGIFIFARLGILGNVSRSFGVDQPVRLGVEYGPLDLALGIKKANVSVEDLPLTDAQLLSIKYTGSHFVDATFSNEEATALLNNGQWRYYPVTEMQVRFLPDQFEASGYLIPDRLKLYENTTSESGGLIDKFLRLLSISKKNIPFFVLAGVKIADGKPTVNVNKIVVGELQIPQSWVNNNQDAINNFIQEKIDFVDGLSIQSLSFSMGEMKFSGNLPDKELIDRAK